MRQPRLIKANITYLDLMAFAKRQAHIDASNYNSAQSYRSDCYVRNKQRKILLQRFGYILKTSDILISGASTDGRLTIASGKIEYCSGQYAPTEIYSAVLSYLNNINKKNTQAK